MVRGRDCLGLGVDVKGEGVPRGTVEGGGGGGGAARGPSILAEEELRGERGGWDETGKK